MTQQPGPEALATRYEDALALYEQDPGVSGRHEAMESAWDAMVDAVEAAGHDVDTHACTACRLYREATQPPPGEERQYDDGTESSTADLIARLNAHNAREN